MSDRPRPAPSGCPTWTRLLDAPTPGAHVAQFHTRPEFLAEGVGRYAAQGLRRGEAVVLIATPPHAALVTRHLESAGVPLRALAGRGLWTVLDAATTLAEVLVDEMPDAARFHAVVGARIAAARAARLPGVRAFGGMVDLLRGTSVSGALRLESLWNELLAAEPGMVLLCGYSLDCLDPGIPGGFLDAVLAAHSHVVPVEDYGRLDRAVSRAYAEVFGTGPDAGNLRRAFLAHYARPATMPDAQAAILAAREFAPATAADAVLDRAWHHYRASAPRLA